MLSSGRWPAGGALLLAGAVIVVGCAKGGAGDTPFGDDTGGFVTMEAGGGTGDASDDSSAGNSGTGLNTSPAGPAGPAGGDDASGASGGNAPAPDCDPTTCANGCCANGACASGMDDNACGQSGGVCTDCTATNQVCSFGSCIAGNESSSGSSAPGPGSSSSGGSATSPPTNPAGGGSCDLSSCTNPCFPLGLPCCTSAGACGCIALYFLPCN